MRATPEQRRYLGAAERAAKAGGVVISSHLPDLVEQKRAGDYVSQVDRDAERAITRALLNHTPEIPVVGEEFGGVPGPVYWLVDPLDGTTNFLHGFPVVGVSIALIENGRPTIGVVSAPFLDELYTAVRDAGAHVTRGTKRAPLSISERTPAQSIVATGFPFRHPDLVDRHLAMVRTCLDRFEDLRRPGAASLDLAWTAAGVFDGFFELGLSPWDVAAGALLVEEAGGRVSDWEGSPDFLSGNIIAGSPAVAAELGRAARDTASVSTTVSEPAQVTPEREQLSDEDAGELFGQLG